MYCFFFLTRRLRLQISTVVFDNNNDDDDDGLNNKCPKKKLILIVHEALGIINNTKSHHSCDKFTWLAMSNLLSDELANNSFEVELLVFIMLYVKCFVSVFK